MRAAECRGGDGIVLTDALAPVVLTLTGIPNERCVAGMGRSEVATARAIGLPSMVLAARPCGFRRDWTLTELPGPRLVRDTVALLVFQLPIDAAIVRIGGADIRKFLRALAGVSVVLPLSGRACGLWPAWVRRRSALPADALKPMSLN